MVEPCTKCKDVRDCHLCDTCRDCKKVFRMCDMNFYARHCLCLNCDVRLSKVKTGETLREAAIRMGKIPGRVYVANGNPNTKKPKEDW